MPGERPEKIPVAIPKNVAIIISVNINRIISTIIYMSLDDFSGNLPEINI